MGGDDEMSICIKQLREIMGTKVYLEFEQYRQEMLRQPPDEIFNLCYQTDCIINIYEHLLIISETATEQELAMVINYPDFINYVYSEWIKIDYEGDLFEFVKNFVRDETEKLYWKEVA